MSADLIERLQEEAGRNVPRGHVAGPLMTKAAAALRAKDDEIARLTRERDHYFTTTGENRDAYNRAEEGRIKALQARIAAEERIRALEGKLAATGQKIVASCPDEYVKGYLEEAIAELLAVIDAEARKG